MFERAQRDVPGNGPGYGGAMGRIMYKSRAVIVVLLAWGLWMCWRVGCLEDQNRNLQLIILALPTDFRDGLGRPR